MSGITDALEAYRANRKAITASYLIYDAIDAALSPFKATGVVLFIDRDIFLESLFVEIRNLPSMKIKLEIDRDLAIRNPQGLYEDIARQAYETIRAIPRIDPPENFILGEN